MEVHFDIFDLLTGFSIVEAMASGHCGTGPEPRRGRCHGGFGKAPVAAYRWEVPSHLSCTLYILKYIFKYISIGCIWNILEYFGRLVSLEANFVSLAVVWC